MGSGYWIADCFSYCRVTMLHGTSGGHSTTLQGLQDLEPADVLILAPSPADLPGRG